MNQFELTGAPADLDRAIGLAEEAVAAAAPDDPARGARLSDLSLALQTRYQLTGAPADLDRAIGLAEEAVAAAAPDDPARGARLSDLSLALQTRYQLTGAPADLDRAIGLAEEAVAAAAPDDPARGARLSDLGAMFAWMGRREDAVAAAAEAVHVHRRLAEADPAAFEPDLATSLNNLSADLSGVGRREEALAASEEAVTMRRELAAARPDAFRPDLATSLANLSNRLADLGRPEEALAAIQEAVTIRRELAAARPDAFRPDLATSLNNLSVLLAGVGRWEEALAAIQEAVEVYRELAAARPDAFRPDLATSLANLSNRLASLGRPEEALAAIQEAVTIRRELAAARPDAFRPDLASSLTNLSVRLAGLGRPEEALAASAEAVTIRRELAADRPDAFRPDLATTLTNLSADLSGVGRREEALAASAEAVTIRRELAADRPDAFRPDLASSLTNLSADLSGVGRREEALAASAEAADIYRELAADRPDAFRPDLATSLGNLSVLLAGLERREEALAAIEEAVTIRRELTAARPEAFRPDLATSLGNLSVLLAGLGRWEEALAPIQEAVTIRRVLAARRPDAYRHELQQSLQVAAWLEHGGDLIQPPLPEQTFQPWAGLAVPAGLSNLPPQPGLFVGRAHELARLDAALAGPGGVVVHGLGGVGKSTLAARWAAARAGDYIVTWWINAATSADIDAGMAALAVALQPALSGVLPLEALREGAVQWLAAHSGWLVILDNVTDPADVAPLLARAPAGRYLITSRRASGWHGTAVPVRLRVFRTLFPVLGLLAALATTTQAQGPGADSAALAAVAAARGGDWAQAYAEAGQSRDPLALKVVRWLDYTRASPEGRFSEIASFIEQNPDWPLHRTMRRRAEEAMASESDDTAADWLKRHPPVSGAGKARAAEIMIDRGNVEAGTAALRAAWVEGDFTATEESALLARFAATLRPEDHEKRLDRLLWDAQIDAARRMLPLVSPDYAAVAAARLALAADTANPAAFLMRVPGELHSDPGLAFEEARWWRKRDNYDAAAQLLLAHDDTPMRPDLWWAERLLVARRLMARGNADIAYRLAQQPGASDGNANPEAEFLSGYIALRYKKDPALAFDHFARILARVTSPYLKARAAYWGGRAAEAAGKPDLAAKWYAAGAEHMATFYGQLAAHQLGRDAPPHPVPEPRPDRAAGGPVRRRGAGPRGAAVPRRRRPRARQGLSVADGGPGEAAARFFDAGLARRELWPGRSGDRRGAARDRCRHAADGARLPRHRAAQRRRRRAGAALGDRAPGKRLCPGRDEPGRSTRPDAADAGDRRQRRPQDRRAVLARSADQRRDLQSRPRALLSRKAAR